MAWDDSSETKHESLELFGLCLDHHDWISLERTFHHKGDANALWQRGRVGFSRAHPANHSNPDAKSQPWIKIARRYAEQ